SGKISAEEVAEPGRAVGRLTDIGWGNRLRELFSSTVDNPVPDDLFDACVKVLAAWGWAERPAGVVIMGSTRRAQLVDSLGERIATVGRLPVLGRVQVEATDERRVNSAQRLGQVWRSLRVEPALAGRLSTVDGPVLVLDVFLESGW